MKPLTLVCLALVTCSPLEEESLVIQADLVSDEAHPSTQSPAVIKLGAEVKGPWLTLKLGGPDLDWLIPEGDRDTITLRLQGEHEVVDVHLQEEGGYLVGSAMVQEEQVKALIYKGPAEANQLIAKGALGRGEGEGYLQRPPAESSEPAPALPPSRD